MSNEPADRPQQILVINPNTSEAVTRAIDEALAPLRRVGGPAIVVDYLREGPPGIVSQRDADSVIPPLAARIGREGADAFVIACFSDPGLQSAREAAMGRPVFGIAECAILSALTMGERFGVIALSSGSVKRQQRDVRLMGVGERYAGSCPADVTPAETASSRCARSTDGRRTDACVAARGGCADSRLRRDGGSPAGVGRDDRPARRRAEPAGRRHGDRTPVARKVLRGSAMHYDLLIRGGACVLPWGDGDHRHRRPRRPHRRPRRDRRRHRRRNHRRSRACTSCPA